MFDLYFAGIQALELDEYLSSKNAHRLFSYADKPKKRLQMFEPTESKIFMDSGAYGVAHSGKEITLDEYIDFINQNPRVTLFACLDVIPWPTLNTATAEISAKKSLENYLYIIERVNEKEKVVPVYHYGEDIKHLKTLLEGIDGYKPPYIAYGGRGGIHTKALYGSLDTFFETIQNIRPDVKTHAFGITVLDLLEKYPFTSADSTSYLQTAINGSVYLECLKGRTLKISDRTLRDNQNFRHQPEQVKNKILEEIEGYGYTLSGLETSFRDRFKFNIDYFLRWQKNYQYKPQVKPKRKKLF